jgi:hypothetical protein
MIIRTLPADRWSQRRRPAALLELCPASFPGSRDSFAKGARRPRMRLRLRGSDLEPRGLSLPLAETTAWRASAAAPRPTPYYARAVARSRTAAGYARRRGIHWAQPRPGVEVASAARDAAGRLDLVIGLPVLAGRYPLAQTFGQVPPQWASTQQPSIEIRCSTTD